MNKFESAWLELVYQRDQFYLYLFFIVITAWLVYRWLRLWRWFKAVVALLLTLSILGVGWGIYQTLS